MIFPNSQRINRGNYEVKQLVEACRSNDVSDLILLHEHRGVPGIIIPKYLQESTEKLKSCVWYGDITGTLKPEQFSVLAGTLNLIKFRHLTLLDLQRGSLWDNVMF